VTRHRPFDVSFPPNETQERIVRWESAIRLDPIPAGATFLEKWSNGHYSDPEVATTELLARDDSGIPTRHCERRVLIDLSEGDGQSPPLSRGDVIRDEILYRIRTAMALGGAKARGVQIDPSTAENEADAATARILETLDSKEDHR